MDDEGVDGRPLPGGCLCTTDQLASKPPLHRPSSKDEIRLPYHHGRGKEVIAVLDCVCCAMRKTYC